MPKTLLRIGARIVQARHEAGVSQSWLSREIGAPIRTISSWENDDFHPRPSSLVLVARATNKPLDWFYRQDESQNGYGTQNGYAGESLDRSPV